MEYAAEVFTKNFSDCESKTAYLNACKWLAQNVISKQVELGKLIWNIEKLTDAKLPTFKLTVYVSVKEKDIREQHCEVCREVHQLFYLNHNKEHCNECKIKAYIKRAHGAMDIKQNNVKEKLKGEL